MVSHLFAYYILFVLPRESMAHKCRKCFVVAALHELDPLYREFTYSSKFLSLVSSLGYRRPVVMQSMYIFKVRFIYFSTFACFFFVSLKTLIHGNVWLLKINVFTLYVDCC